MMTREPTENDLLTEFEQLHIPEHYKPFYLPKRHNFMGTIQNFPYLWNCFMHLDEIVLREFDVMQRVSDPALMFPTILFMNAHVKVRIALELGCSTCITEAQSLMRDAIESAAHGHRLASDPQLLKPWIEKNDSEAAKKIFSNEFEHHKADRLFDGLPQLHKMWKQFSEFGSHTNLNSIQLRFVIEQTATDLQYRLNYVGGDPRVFVPALFEMILVFVEIEAIFFKLAHSRLQLDTQLVDKRTKFDQEKEAARWHTIKTFNLQRPAVP